MDFVCVSLTMYTFQALIRVKINIYRVFTTDFARDMCWEVHFIDKAELTSPWGTLYWDDHHSIGILAHRNWEW